MVSLCIWHGAADMHALWPYNSYAPFVHITYYVHYAFFSTCTHAGLSVSLPPLPETVTG